jgi:hypothetical protein
MRIHWRALAGASALALCTSLAAHAQQIDAKQLKAGAAAANLGYQPLSPSSNLSDVASVTAARTNLGLGSAALINLGSGVGAALTGAANAANGISVLDGAGSVSLSVGGFTAANNTGFSEKNNAGTVKTLLYLDSANVVRLFSAGGNLLIGPDQNQTTYINYNNTSPVQIGDSVSTTNLLVAKGSIGVGTSSPGSPLSFGTGFIGTAGAANVLRLYDNGSSSYGFGISTGLLNIVSGGNTEFWNGGSAALLIGGTSIAAQGSFGFAGDGSALTGIVGTNVSFNQGDTGAVTRTSQAHNQDFIDVLDYLPVGQPDGTTDNSSGFQAAATAGCARTSHGMRIEVPAPRTASKYKSHDVVNNCSNFWHGSGGGGFGTSNNIATSSITNGGSTIDYSGATSYGMAWSVPNFPNFTPSQHLNGGGISDMYLIDGVSTATALISDGTYDWKAFNLVINGPYNGVYMAGDEFPVTSHISMYGTRNINYYIHGDLTGQTSSGAACIVSHAATSSGALITWTAHGLAAGNHMWFYGTLPGGLSATVGYYVIATGLTANSFEVSLTPGGAAVTPGTGSFTAVHDIGQGDCSTRNDAWYGEYLNNIDNGQTNNVFAIEGFVATPTLSHTTGEGPANGMVVTCPANMDPGGSNCPAFGRMDDIQIENYKYSGVILQDVTNWIFDKLYAVGDGSTNTNNAFAAYTQNYNPQSAPMGRIRLLHGELFATGNACAYFAGTMYDIVIEDTDANACNINNNHSGGFYFTGTIADIIIAHNRVGTVGNYSGTTLENAVSFNSFFIYNAIVQGNLWGSITSTNPPVYNGSNNQMSIHVSDNVSELHNVLALGSCGTGSTVSGNDESMLVNVGTGTPTACTVNFNTPRSTAPRCVGSLAPGATTLSSLSTSVSSVTLNGAGLSGGYQVLCRED